MKELAVAYIDFLQNLKEIKKPKMPKVKVDAYNDVEYQKAIKSIMHDYDTLYDEKIYEQFLKGDWWKLIGETSFMQTLAQ